MARSTIIIGDQGGPFGDAIDKLASLAERGLTRPFWCVDSVMQDGQNWLATYCGRSGKEEVALFSSLGEYEAEQIQIATVASVGDEIRSSDIANVANQIRVKVRSLAPSASAIAEARIWFPAWEEVSEPDRRFFSPEFHANLVVIPEDRRSEGHLAAPMTPRDPSAFAGHIAAELSVLLGLFAGMGSSPIDEMQPGVIFGSNPKVRLVRSFLRIGQSPALPLQDIVEHDGRLPLPPGTIEAPSPQVAVAELEDRSDPIFRNLVFTFLEPDALERIQLGPGETLSIVLKEMASFLGALPRRAVAGVLEDFSELAGRTMQDLVGSSSVVEVVWKGKLRSDPSEPEDFESMIPTMRIEAERRLDLQGGPSIDQAVWRDISRLVIGAVDGGALPAGVEPIEIHGRRAVINDAVSIAPRPREDLVNTAALIQDESQSQQPLSLIGRLGARIEGIAQTNNAAMAQLLRRLETSIGSLMTYRPPTLGFWHLAGAVLLAAFVAATLLFSGAARGMGIAGLSSVPRDIVYGVLTLGTMGLLFLFRTYATEALEEQLAGGADPDSAESSVAVGWGATGLGAGLGVLVAGMFIGLGVAALGYPATEPATYAALITGAVTGAGLGQALRLGELEREHVTAGRMARLSVLTVLVFCSILTIGAVAQPRGWYATAPGAEIRSWLWPISGPLFLALLLVLVYVSWRRVQERLTLNALGSNIRQLAEQVNAALVGDRIAEAAREQFLGLSAVLARLIWYPYGKSSTPGGRTDGVLASFGVNKATICNFGLSDRGEMLFSARTKTLATERGWLGKQYERSILRYRQEVAVIIGADDVDSVRRPDQDPTSVAHHAPEARSGKGDRWSWAENLFAGQFDRDLMQTLELHGHDEVFIPILSDSANFTPVGDCAEGRSLLSFNEELLVDSSTVADSRYFDADHLAGGHFSRAWHSQIWWPQEELFSAGHHSGLQSIDPSGSMAGGRIWIAVRADMTEDFQPAAMFGDEGLEIPLDDPSGPEF